MESLKRKGEHGVNALLEATKEWNPYCGAAYDELRRKADSHLAKQRSSLGRRSPRWYEVWRWFKDPCDLVGCKDMKHDGTDGPAKRFLFLAFLAVAGAAWGSYSLAPPGFEILQAVLVMFGTAAFLATAAFADASLGLRDWRTHAKELDRLRSRMGHADMLVSYMVAEVGRSRTALIGDDRITSPLRIAQKKLAVRLEEIRALTTRLQASLEHEKDARLLAVLRSGQREAAALEEIISAMKTKVDERIAQIKAFFDECEARIRGLEAPVLVMAMSHELALHRSAAEQEMREAEDAIADALFDLQAKWVAFQQTANTLLPQAVAKVFGETGGSGEEKQNLEVLEAAMDRVFDTLPALPSKPVAVS